MARCTGDLPVLQRHRPGQRVVHADRVPAQPVRGRAPVQADRGHAVADQRQQVLLRHQRSAQDHPAHALRHEGLGVLALALRVAVGVAQQHAMAPGPCRLFHPARQHAKDGLAMVGTISPIIGM